MATILTKCQMFLDDKAQVARVHVHGEGKLRFKSLFGVDVADELPAIFEYVACSKCWKSCFAHDRVAKQQSSMK